MGVFERRVMRGLVQLEHPAQVGQILQKLHDAPVVGLEELPQNQNGKELVLREIVAGEWRRIDRQGVACHSQGHPGQRHRRPRHAASRAHKSCNDYLLPST